MFIVLAGLHGAGKSHLAELARAKFGWTVSNKRDLLKQLHDQENPGTDWVEWYRSLYAAIGPYAVTRQILDLLAQPSDGNTIFNSVHNLTEWAAVKDMCPDSVLVLVVAPKSIRAARNDAGDTTLDLQRIHFWHESDDKDTSCLAAEAEWVVNGGASEEVLITEFRALLDHIAHPR